MYAHTVQPCTSKVQGSTVKGSITTSTVRSTRLSGFGFRDHGFGFREVISTTFGQVIRAIKKRENKVLGYQPKTCDI